MVGIPTTSPPGSLSSLRMCLHQPDKVSGRATFCFSTVRDLEASCKRWICFNKTKCQRAGKECALTMHSKCSCDMLGVLVERRTVRPEIALATPRDDAVASKGAYTCMFDFKCLAANPESRSVCERYSDSNLIWANAGCRWRSMSSRVTCALLGWLKTGRCILDRVWAFHCARRGNLLRLCLFVVVVVIRHWPDSHVFSCLK